MTISTRVTATLATVPGYGGTGSSLAAGMRSLLREAVQAEAEP